MNCKQCFSLFTEALYRELSDQRQKEFDQHLADCRKCDQSFQELRSTLQVLDQRKRLSPESQFLDSLWANLRPELETDTAAAKTEGIESNWFQRIFTAVLLPKWTLGFAAAVALFALGILVGKAFFKTQPDSTQQFVHRTNPDPAQVQEIERRSARYLDRSKVLLLGLINYEPAEADTTILNLDVKKEVSQRLVREASTLKDELSQIRQLRLQKLVSYIEMILLQIANLEETQDLPSIEIIRSSVDRKGILLKINLEQMKNQNNEPIQQDSPDKKSTI